MSTGLSSTHRHRSSRLAWLSAGASSAEQLRRRMARSGFTLAGQKLWSEAETKLLRRHYPDYPRACSALPERTRNAIGSKAFRLRITRPLRVWSDDELRRLKAPYRQGVPVRQIQALLTGKTARQIWSRAAHSGWRRPRRPPKRTGLKPFDDIRMRAFALGMTMRDLAALSGTGSYFLKPSSRCDWKKIGKAAVTLDGHLSVVWEAA